MQQKTCNFTSQSVGASMSGIITITSGVESHLQAAVTFAGPVAAAVDAKSTAFRVSCSMIPYIPYHAIIICMTM